jgi:enoyl-[acyl-carrier protein] reductase I
MTSEAASMQPAAPAAKPVETMSGNRLLEGKRALIFGVANDRSIAWGITQALFGAGARCALTYAGEPFERRVRPLAESVDADIIVPCDVTDGAQIAAVFDDVRRTWGGLDILIHSVAFANRENLEGRFVETDRAGFLKAIEVSAYSLVELTRHAEPLLIDSQGSIITLSYYGAEKVVPHYNVMGVAKATLEACVRYLAADLGPVGVRINAISAGPIKTLAASGVKGFKTMLGIAEERAPLRRSVTQNEVGSTALFLCSGMGSGVTGEILHVDAGYNVLGM